MILCYCSRKYGAGFNWTVERSNTAGQNRSRHSRISFFGPIQMILFVYSSWLWIDSKVGQAIEEFTGNGEIIDLLATKKPPFDPSCLITETMTTKRYCMEPSENNHSSPTKPKKFWSSICMKTKWRCLVPTLVNLEHNLLSKWIISHSMRALPWRGTHIWWECDNNSTRQDVEYRWKFSSRLHNAQIWIMTNKRTRQMSIVSAFGLPSPVHLAMNSIPLSVRILSAVKFQWQKWSSNPIYCHHF